MSKKADKPHSLTNQVMNEVRIAILFMEKESVLVISPMAVEQRVIKCLDPDIVAPLLVNHLARLQLRQLCRQLLITRSQEHDAKATQQAQLSASIFDVQLQPYYPAKREGEEVYVRRDHLTLAERRYNEARLRAEARAKNIHADALRAETDSLYPEEREQAA